MVDNDRALFFDRVICPVCGAVAVQEKCKMICRSETCGGRIVMNYSEF